MTEDKFADEMLTDDELDGVTGGTAPETGEIANLIYQKTGTRIGYYDIIDYLKDNYGIEAELSGAPYIEDFGRPNVYSLNGEKITHDQVVKMLKSS